MKRIERHHLKDNELATTLADLSRRVEARRQSAALRRDGRAGDRRRGDWASPCGGSGTQSRGQELLAEAMVALNARVVPATAAGAEGDAPAAAQIGATGSFSTEEAKLTAAIPKLQAAADAAPSSAAGVTARYHLAGALAAVGRHADAIAAFEEVSRRAGPDQLLRPHGADGAGRRAGARRAVRRGHRRLEGAGVAAGRASCRSMRC